MQVTSDMVTIKVRRLRDACCGMENGRVYTARTRPFWAQCEGYIQVLLPDGTWTSDHWAPGFFEVVQEGAYADQPVEA